MAFKGIDIRQTSDRLVFRALLQNSTGDLLTTGTTTLKLYELQTDGTLMSYDFTGHTFKTTALTTETLAMTHRKGNNATTNTGIWTANLTTLTGFTAGNIYLAMVNNTGASPKDQQREFQFGSVEGDLSISVANHLDVNVAQVSDDTIAADDLELMVEALGSDNRPLISIDTNIIQVVPSIPTDIDLANTATVRFALAVTNMIDNLPVTGEITPGTIDIAHKAIGGTFWSTLVSAPCLEAGGLIYFDEVFDAATGYAEGDSIRVTFKGQKIAVGGNDYEISDATGRMFQTSIRQTAGSVSISNILNIVPMIPSNIDLADTAPVRVGFMLTNALDDLPATAEITPGIITIDRKAEGGTTWLNIVTDAACSEAAGVIYYSRAYGAASLFAKGDSVRFTFKNQKVTVAGNDYEITGSGGRIFYSSIRQASTGASTDAIADAVLDELMSGHTTAGSLGEELHMVKAMLANKRTHIISTGVDQVMDDDGSTVLRTLTPTDGGDDTITVNPS